jgi:hypothetical protein
MKRTMDTAAPWQELLKHPCNGDHLVQVYQDEEFLADTVAEYAGTALHEGEAVIIIATPEHRRAFLGKLGARGLFPDEAIRRGQLRLLDGAETLGKFMRDGIPDWQLFHQTVGGALAELRLQYPTVRAYGEMVDVLWRAGRQDAAIRLEEFWNELGTLQTFSLLCAYYIDNLDALAYGGPPEGGPPEGGPPAAGPLERICKVHTHLIPARDYNRFNQAVSQASKQVLDQPLAQMLLSLSASHRPATQMPLGQATLFWLRKNMPRTADKVLTQIKEQLA